MTGEMIALVGIAAVMVFGTLVAGHERRKSEPPYHPIPPKRTFVVPARFVYRGRAKPLPLDDDTPLA